MTKPFSIRGIFPISLTPLYSYYSYCFGYSYKTSSLRLIYIISLFSLLTKANIDKSLGVLSAAYSCVICFYLA
jgi:hypothetical protein